MTASTSFPLNSSAIFMQSFETSKASSQIQQPHHFEQPVSSHFFSHRGNMSIVNEQRLTMQQTTSLLYKAVLTSHFEKHASAEKIQEKASLQEFSHVIDAPCPPTTIASLLNNKRVAYFDALQPVNKKRKCVEEQTLLDTPTSLFAAPRNVIAAVAALSEETLQRMTLFTEPLIKARAAQIATVAAAFLSFQSIENIATCIENNIPNIDIELAKTIYVKKKSGLLNKSLFVDFTSQALFILLKKDSPFPTKIGSFKKVSNAIMVPFSHQKKCSLVVQKVTKDCLNEKQKDLCQQELRFLTENNTTLLPLLSFGSYLKYSKDPLTPQKSFVTKICSFEPLFDGDCSKLPPGINSYFNKYLIGYQLLQHVNNFHKRGYFHGDIKPANVLWKIDPRTNILHTALTDFGFSYAPEKDAAKGPIMRGYYGTIPFTAPELFGKSYESIQDVDLFKAECWAVGMTLYQLAYSQFPSFTNYIHQMFVNGFDGILKKPLISHHNKYRTHINSDIESHTLQLEEEIKENKSDPYLTILKRAALCLFDPNPKRRKSLDVVKQLFDQNTR